MGAVEVKARAWIANRDEGVESRALVALSSSMDRKSTLLIADRSAFRTWALSLVN
jgi:hypothetical protein